MASRAPVVMTSSWLRWFPAWGMPFLINSSFPVQQRPTRLMPFAPASSALLFISGSEAAFTTISERMGL